MIFIFCRSFWITSTLLHLTVSQCNMIHYHSYPHATHDHQTKYFWCSLFGWYEQQKNTYCSNPQYIKNGLEMRTDNFYRFLTGGRLTHSYIKKTKPTQQSRAQIVEAVKVIRYTKNTTMVLLVKKTQPNKKNHLPYIFICICNIKNCLREMPEKWEDQNLTRSTQLVLFYSLSLTNTKTINIFFKC